MNQIKVEYANELRRRRGDQWARQELELTATATPREVRTAMLNCVEESEFVPSDKFLPAYAWLQGECQDVESWPQCSEFVSYDEQQLCQQVDEFAAGLFQLQPAARRHRYNELSHATFHSPRAKGRLKLLVRGLDLDVQQLIGMDATSRGLADHLICMFPLNSLERATRRAQIMAMLSREKTAKDWAKCAKRFRLTYPAFAALDPPLINRLTDKSAEAGKMAKFERKRATNRPIRTTRSNSGGQSRWWVIGLAVMIASAIGRLATFEDKTPSRNYRSVNPKILQEQLRQLDGFEIAPNESNNQDAVKELLRRIREERNQGESLLDPTATGDTNSAEIPAVPTVDSLLGPPSPGLTPNAASNPEDPFENLLKDLERPVRLTPKYVPPRLPSLPPVRSPRVPRPSIPRPPRPSIPPLPGPSTAPPRPGFP